MPEPPLLETVVLVSESGDEMGVHAMPARKKYLDPRPDDGNRTRAAGLGSGSAEHVLVTDAAPAQARVTVGGDEL